MPRLADIAIALPRLAREIDKTAVRATSDALNTPNSARPTDTSRCDRQDDIRQARDDLIGHTPSGVTCRNHLMRHPTRHRRPSLGLLHGRVRDCPGFWCRSGASKDTSSNCEPDGPAPPQAGGESEKRPSSCASPEYASAVVTRGARPLAPPLTSSHESRERKSRLRPRVGTPLPTLAWLVAGLLTVLAESTTTGEDFGPIVLSALAMAWGIVTFWRAGGRMINGSALNRLWCGFVHRLSNTCDSDFHADYELMEISSVAYLGAVSCALFFQRQRQSESISTATAPRDVVKGGLAIATVCAMPSAAPAVPSTVAAPLLFASIIMATNSLLVARQFGRAIAIATSGSAVYVWLNWDGFGRLALGCTRFSLAGSFASMATEADGQVRRASLVVPVLLLLGSTRIQLEEARNPFGATSQTGLQSIASPIYTGARVLDLIQDGTVPRAWGATYF